MSVNTQYGSVSRYTIEDREINGFICPGDLKMFASSIDKIDSAGCVSMLRSKSDYIYARGAILDIYGTIGSAFSNKHVIFDNTKANLVISDGDIRLRFASIYDSVITMNGSVYLSHSTIQQNVTAYHKEIILVKSSHVGGALTCPNVHLEIKDSTINELNLIKPNPEGLNQTVVLSNSHVSRIKFGNGMGIVKLEGSSQVGEVVGGVLR